MNLVWKERGSKGSTRKRHFITFNAVFWEECLGAFLKLTIQREKESRDMPESRRDGKYYHKEEITGWEPCPAIHTHD